MFVPGALHLVVLGTAGGDARLEGAVLREARHALDSLARRFPGLKVAGASFTPSTASLLLDFSRCDEDTPRVVQSYKTEVRKLAAREGFSGVHFWRREFEERTVETQAEWDALKAAWNL
jgi:hypothetical protein